MTAAPQRRPAGEEGVSSVLGAILVFGLFVVTLVTIQVRFVPVWDRDREANLMQTDASQMAAIKADVDRQADNRTVVPITDPITLGTSTGFRFFSGGTLPADISYAPPAAGTGFQVTTPQLRILTQNGRALYGGTESWIGVGSGGSIANVASVQHFRLRISTPAAWATGDSVTLTILDANNAYQGKFYLHDIDHGGTYSYEYQTFAASSQTTPISITQDDFDKGSPPTYQYIDLLRSDLQFGDILAAATAPYTIQINHVNMASDYTIAYQIQVPGGGTTSVGNPGLPVPNYSLLYASGALQMASHNNRFVRQTYTLEHGAVIVTQPDGQVMAAAPQFTAAVVAGQLNVALVVPALTGTASTVSGPEQAAVTLTPAGTRTDVVGTAAKLTFTITTLTPSVWTGYWTTTLQAAGITNTGGTPQFSTTTTATSATLNLFGLQSDPNSTVDDIQLTLKAGAILASARAAGTGG